MSKTKTLSVFEQGKTCPLQLEEKFIPCDIEELKPIIGYLENNSTSNETLTFTKGTIIDGNRLDLCKQKIGPEGTKLVTQALINNNIINSLMLGADGILNEGAFAVSNLIQHNQTIETVYLGCNLIDGKGANSLANALKVNKSVSGLWLKRNPIGDEGVESLAEMLKFNNQIKSLDLVNTEFSLVGLKKLTKVLLEENHSVNRIYLGGNHLSAESALEIAPLLSKENLKGLYLNVNNLGDEGCKYLAVALKNNKHLEDLALSSNNIGVVGISSLCKVLESHQEIKTLDFGYSPSTKVLGAKANYIGDEGIDAICDLIKKNKSLRVLNLLKTNITELGLEKLLEALENNTTLVKLDVDTKDSKKNKNKNTRNLKKKWRKLCF